MALVDVVDTHAESGALRHPPLVVREPLAAWLDHAGLRVGALEVQRIGEGMSNATFLVGRGPQRLVLRRPPRPPTPPSAHDVVREARLLRALARTQVPVPRVLAVCDDVRVIGAPFYVMEWIEGTVIANTLPASLAARRERRAIGEALVDALVEIHAVDPHEAGLDTFGRPDGYLERQVRRFGRLWNGHRTRTVPDIDAVGRRLAERLPRSPDATIVHGDFRLANAMWAVAPPARLLAVLDWEMATLGDPLADLGMLAASWSQPGDPPTMYDALAPVPGMEGFPTRDELVALYAQRSGRSVDALPWYRALALWKTAVIMEGNFRRYQEGGSSDVYLGSFDEAVPVLARAAAVEIGA